VPVTPLFVGDPALVVVDIQRGSDMPASTVGISHMEGAAERIALAERLVSAARSAGVPVIFFQEGARRTGEEIIEAFAALPRLAGASR
jgi:nicotinamidase-related amidase